MLGNEFWWHLEGLYVFVQRNMDSIILLADTGKARGRAALQTQL